MDSESMNTLTSPLDEIQSNFFNAKFNEAKTVGDLKNENPFTSDFKPVRMLGTGAFGKVYLAKSQKADKERAIKVIDKSDYYWKNEKEFKILKELNHPNIIRYYGSYDYKRKIYLVTEYCNGKELLSEIMQNGRLTEKEAQNYFREITEALCYLHSRNIIHRDLKPENILIEKDTKLVKILDFGLSKKLFDANIHMKSEVGTLIYSSPEVDAGYYNEKCDIWSMGMILYVTLTGEMPFPSQKVKDIIRLKKKFTPEFKGYKWDRVSDKAKDFLLNCICKKEKERMTAIEALNHPWLCEEASDTLILDEKQVGQLYTYSKQCRLINNIKYFVCAFNELQKKEKDIVDLFKRIDIDKDGEISKKEMLVAYNDNKMVFKSFNIKRSDIELLFNQVDLDCSGSIDFLEFLVAMKNLSVDLNKNNLKRAFEELSNESEFVDLHSLSVSLGTKLPESEWLILLKKYDKDGNGKIDFNEFLDIFGN